MKQNRESDNFRTPFRDVNLSGAIVLASFTICSRKSLRTFASVAIRAIFTTSSVLARVGIAVILFLDRQERQMQLCIWEGFILEYFKMTQIHKSLKHDRV